MSRENLEKALRNWQEKLAHYEYELSLTSSPETKFELKKKIQECEQKIERLNKKINLINREPFDDVLEPVTTSSPQHDERDIDYTQLRHLLATGEWKAADQETFRVMLKAADREEQGYLTNADLSKLSHQVLCTVNQLWLEYSSSHFGFSIQKQIWQEAEQDYRKFSVAVGWNRDGWISYEDFTFSLNAPRGHLPSPPLLVYNPSSAESLYRSLFSRQDI